MFLVKSDVREKNMNVFTFVDQHLPQYTTDEVRPNLAVSEELLMLCIQSTS
jgi:hypothetical protein